MYQCDIQSWRPKTSGKSSLLLLGITKGTGKTKSTACAGEYLFSRNICVPAELRVLSSLLPAVYHLLGKHCRCAFNCAVQKIAVLPDVNKYLKDLCSSGEDALTLHRALDTQLDELAAAAAGKKSAVLDGFLPALDKVAGLGNIARRSRQVLPCALHWTCRVSLSLCRESHASTLRSSSLAGCCRHGVLCEDAGVHDVYTGVCVALHEEYVACTGEVRSHKAMFASFPLTAATVTLCTQERPSAVAYMLHSSLLV